MVRGSGVLQMLWMLAGIWLGIFMARAFDAPQQAPCRCEQPADPA